MTERSLGVLGATSLVGDSLLPRLAAAGWRVVAFSRKPGNNGVSSKIVWRQIDSAAPGAALAVREEQIPYWLCLAPIRVLPSYFARLETCGVRRVVALSSTSRFAKIDSRDPLERKMARELAEGETRLQEWAEKKGIEWAILRPTLIYSLGRDKNISEIAHFIERFTFFPLCGPARGRRQPIHAEAVAAVCVAALESVKAVNQSYNISGGEILTYREMVGRVFAALGRPPRFLPVPLPLFRVAVNLLRLLPRYRHWSVAMVERMNQDLVFDHSAAVTDLQYRPEPFNVHHPPRD